ncbi:hypothetical protein N7527_009518 [Penicillium freii]|nr:hypothetical protein N7527_009518 [Penicillium freii]
MQMKDYYDRRHQPKHFEVGDKVLLRIGRGYSIPVNDAISRKLGQQYIHPVISLQHLEPAPSPDPFDRELPQDPEPTYDERFPDDPDRHDVSAVLDMRVRHLGRCRTPVKEYLIQWEGEPREQCQWVKERNAVGAEQKIREFEDAANETGETGWEDGASRRWRPATVHKWHLAGKMVTIKDQEGKDRVVKAGPYYTGGPSRFVTNRTDAISSHEIAVKIAAVIPRTFFVLDEMRIGNTTGPKKRIVFADPILELFDLPAPGKEICIMWNRLLWLGAKLETMPKPDLQARWRKIYNSLSGHFEIPCLTEQGPPFYRPLHYLVAAFFEAR